MLTRNWYNLFKNYFLSTDNSLGIKPVNTAGNETVVYAYQTHSALFPINATGLSTGILTAGGICFGDGNTAPTMDDYTLSGAHLTTLVARHQATYQSVDGDAVVMRTDYVLENTGATAVTVREVAWVAGHRSTPSYSHYFMLDRTLLDSPVTIEPGCVAKVTYTRSAVVPTA